MTKPKETTRPGEVPKERLRTVPEETWKPQRLLRPTSALAATTLFTLAVYPSEGAVSQVLREVQHEQFLRWLSQMRSDPAKRDNTRYCEFYRDYEHHMDDCIQLRKEIEYLIRRGYLHRFIASEGQAQSQA